MNDEQAIDSTASFECPLIEIAGAPRARGRQYGEQASHRIQRGIDLYSGQLESNRLGWPDVRSIAASFEPKIEDFDPALLDEMRGIAEGANVEFAAVLMINARTEILELAERQTNARPVVLDPDGCTSIAVLPEASASGTLIHAQNWDWNADCAGTAVVVKIRRTEGPDILTFTEAGGLARSGMNAAGISVTANYLGSDRDYRQVGMPLALLRRKALEQSRLAAAMGIIYSTPKSSSNNVLVAHAHGIAIDFECAPDETFQIHAERGVIVHANHFQSMVALAKLRDVGVSSMPDSLYRDLRVRSLVDPFIGSLDAAHVRAALFDDFETPWSVCRPPRRKPNGRYSASVATILMEPSRGRMEVTMLPALNRNAHQFQLEMQIEPCANNLQGLCVARPSEG